MTECPEIPWSGLEVVGTLTGVTQNGHVGTTEAKSTGIIDAPPSVTIPGVELAFGSSHVEIAYDGAAHDGANVAARRGSSGYLANAYFPLMWSRLAGYGATLRYSWWCHAAGVDVASDGPRPIFYNSQKAGATTFGPPNYAAASVNNTTGSGYGSIEFSIPATEAWNGTAFEPNWSHELGAVIPAGQILASDGPVFAIERPGTVIVNWSQGGSFITRWTKTTIFADSVFDTLVNMKGPNPVLLLECAENLGYYPTQASMQAQLQAIARRFRTGGRDCAPVIIHTGYPSSTSGYVWDAWTQQACATIPGCLFIDTHGTLPAYADGVAAGYYDPRAVPVEPYQTDGVHYGPTIGIPAFAAAIGDLIAAKLS
jgi:hypothetical protein